MLTFINTIIHKLIKILFRKIILIILFTDTDPWMNLSYVGIKIYLLMYIHE